MTNTANIDNYQFLVIVYSPIRFIIDLHALQDLVDSDAHDTQILPRQLSGQYMIQTIFFG